MIKFLNAVEMKKQQLTYGDVERNQFFIDVDNCLCQKYTDYIYHIIASPYGVPSSMRITTTPSSPIQKILETITHIEYD